MKTLIALLILLIAPALALADTCSFTTYGQTAWGTSPSGNNSAAYRNAHFANAFPQGVRVGDAALNSALFTSSKAVQLYLPATGVAGVFDATTTNATSTSSGVFGGEVVSLALNIGFDIADEQFGASTMHFEDLAVVSGFCSGMRVKDVLEQANRALSGEPTALTVSQLYNCSATINKNYENGADLGVLSCTGPAPAPQNTTNITSSTSANESTNVTINETAAVQSTASLRIARWYPKGTHYVFHCDADGFTPTSYSWWFGDGEKLLQIRNQNVYHIYRGAGNYTVMCTAHGNSTNASATMHVSPVV